MQVMQSMSAEELARLFYQYRDTLASDFGFHSSAGCVPWEQILPEQRNLMVASARLVLLDLAGRQEGQRSHNQDSTRKNHAA